MHRDWGRHVATLRHMVRVDGLLLLRLLMHSGVHLVLLGTTTCIRRPLPKVLRRTGPSLLSRGVGGEPCSRIGGCRISPRTLGWALIGGISPGHDAADWRQLPFTFLNHPLPTLVPNDHRRHSLHQEGLDHRWGGERSGGCQKPVTTLENLVGLLSQRNAPSYRERKPLGCR